MSGIISVLIIHRMDEGGMLRRKRWPSRRTQMATRTAPIVFVAVTDPVGAGLSIIWRGRAAIYYDHAEFAPRHHQSRANARAVDERREYPPEKMRIRQEGFRKNDLLAA